MTDIYLWQIYTYDRYIPMTDLYLWQVHIYDRYISVTDIYLTDIYLCQIYTYDRYISLVERSVYNYNTNLTNSKWFLFTTCLITVYTYIFQSLLTNRNKSPRTNRYTDICCNVCTCRRTDQVTWIHNYTDIRKCNDYTTGNLKKHENWKTTRKLLTDV